MLQFIGKGSAFNTELGNNCAYMKNENNLLLIDCGSSTFAKIQQSNLLENVNSVFVLMTHTHPDHVGSLGDLIFYGYYAMGEMLKPNVTVIAPPELNIESVLKGMGVSRETYNLYNLEDRATRIGKMNIMIQSVPVNHVRDLACFGYIIYSSHEVTYYSGDCYDIPEEILNLLNLDTPKFDYFYQDTCKADYDGNVHLSLRKLTELVREESRKFVYCMHLDDSFDKKEAESLGFKVVSSIFDRKY